MSIPIFSLVYIIVIIVIFLSKVSLKRKYLYYILIACLLEICAFPGYFIMIGSKEYAIYKIHYAWMAIFSLFYLYINRITVNKYILYGMLFFVSIPLLSILLECIYPYDGMIIPMDGSITTDAFVVGDGSLIKYSLDFKSSISGYINLFVYGFMVFIIKHDFNKDDIKFIIRCLVKVSYIMITWGYIEYFIKNVIGNLQITYKIPEMIFGLGKSTYTYEALKFSPDVFRLQGFTREPSHFVLELIWLAIFIMLSNEINKQDRMIEKIPLILILILLPLTGGFSALWGIFIVLTSYVMLSIDIKKIIGISSIMFLILLVVGCCILFGIGDSVLLIANRLDAVIDAIHLLLINPNSLLVQGIDGSFLSRFLGIYLCFNNWLDRPMLGLGVYSTYAHDVTFSMLANFGILGTYGWLYYITRNSNKYVKYNMAFIVWVIFINGIPFGAIRDGSFYVFFVILVEATSLINCGTNNKIIGR